jgi:hypothetical protein
MEVSGKLHDQVALPPVPILQEAGLTLETVWTRWRRETTAGSPVRSLVTILTELPWGSGENW